MSYACEPESSIRTQNAQRALHLAFRSRSFSALGKHE